MIIKGFANVYRERGKPFSFSVFVYDLRAGAVARYDEVMKDGGLAAAVMDGERAVEVNLEIIGGRVHDGKDQGEGGDPRVEARPDTGDGPGGDG